MAPYCRRGPVTLAGDKHVLILCMAWLGIWLLLLCVNPARAQIPDEHLQALKRGINITNWFRFPADTRSGPLRDYLPDAVMTELRQAGFTFVRLCIQPQILLRADG